MSLLPNWKQVAENKWNSEGSQDLHKARNIFSHFWWAAWSTETGYCYFWCISSLLLCAGGRATFAAQCLIFILHGSQCIPSCISAQERHCWWETCTLGRGTAFQDLVPSEFILQALSSTQESCLHIWALIEKPVVPEEQSCQEESPSPCQDLCYPSARAQQLVVFHLLKSRGTFHLREQEIGEKSIDQTSFIPHLCKERNKRSTIIMF